MSVLIKRWGIPQNRPLINVWIDNEEALSQAGNWKTPLIKLKEYGASDYSIKCVMHKAIKEVSASVKFKFLKVKSHQTGDPSDLPFEAKLNNLANELAELIRTQVQGSMQLLLIPLKILMV